MADLIVGENSYVSVAEADTFFSNYLYSDTWEATDEETKKKALITATSMLDINFIWWGIKTDPDQTLDFPRTSTVYNIGCGNNDPENIPKEIKDATCIQAQYILDNNVYVKKDRIKKAELDVMNVEYFESNYDDIDMIYNVVENRLRCYGKLRYSNSDAGMTCSVRA